MRRAIVFVHGKRAGILTELSARGYSFEYDDNYKGAVVSLTIPTSHKNFFYKSFPPFFNGLLPEGVMLQVFLRISKIDKNEFFSQLIAKGNNLAGAVTVKFSENE